MPSVQEIVRHIKNARGKLFRDYQVVPDQHCHLIEDVIREKIPQGQVWVTDDHSMADDYVTHVVGVFPVRKKGGIIAQFSGARHEDTAIVVGNVTDVTSERNVRRSLEKHTRKKGWRRFR